jgi:hypothetical protein
VHGGITAVISIYAGNSASNVFKITLAGMQALYVPAGYPEALAVRNCVSDTGATTASRQPQLLFPALLARGQSCSACELNKLTALLYQSHGSPQATVPWCSSKIVMHM